MRVWGLRLKAWDRLLIMFTRMPHSLIGLTQGARNTLSHTPLFK